MNIKQTLFFFTVSCLLINPPPADAQNKGNKWPPDKFPHEAKNCFHLFSNSYQCTWIYYPIRETLEGTLVAYDTVVDPKKGSTNAYVSIIKKGDDTIRVLHLTPCKNKIGDHVSFMQAREPELDVFVHFDRDFFMNEEEKGNKPMCRINQYDSRIYKTTWGSAAVIRAPAAKKAAPVKKTSAQKA